MSLIIIEFKFDGTRMIDLCLVLLHYCVQVVTGNKKQRRIFSNGSDPRFRGAQIMLPRSAVVVGPLPTSTTTTTIKSLSAVREEERMGGLFGRPEINCDRILAFVRNDRTLARSLDSIYSLALYRAESLLSLSPFVPLFLHTSTPRTWQTF